MACNLYSPPPLPPPSPSCEFYSPLSLSHSQFLRPIRILTCCRGQYRATRCAPRARVMYPRRHNRPGSIWVYSHSIPIYIYIHIYKYSYIYLLKYTIYISICIYMCICMYLFVYLYNYVLFNIYAFQLYICVCLCVFMYYSFHYISIYFQ